MRSQSRWIAPVGFFMSVRLFSCISEAATGRISVQFDTGDFTDNLSEEISGILGEDPSTIYCCRQHKFATKVLLGNIWYFCIIASVIWLGNAQKTSLLRFHCKRS